MTSLIDLHIEYHKMRTSSPVVFAKHLSIQNIGHSLGRESICKIQPRAVHHNIYLCLLGKSGRSLKTTAQEDVAKPLIPTKHQGTASSSPQGMLRILEEEPQRNFPLGEFSTVLRGIMTGGHMTDFKEITNDLWSCPPYYERRLAQKDNSYIVQKPYLSMSTTCTTEEFFPNLKPEMIHGGFMPRWILVPVKNAKREDRKILPDYIDAIERLLVNIQVQMYIEFDTHPLKFVPTPDALTYYNDLCDELADDEEWEDVQPFVKRYENYILSYADILYVSDKVGELLESLGLSKLSELKELSKVSKLRNDIVNTTNSFRKNLYNLVNSLNSVNSVDENYIEKAWHILEPSLKYTKQIIHYVDEDFVIAKLKYHLDKVDKKIQWSVLLRNSGFLSKDFGAIINTLVLRGEVEIVLVTTGEGQSKKTTQWVTKTKEYR